MRPSKRWATFRPNRGIALVALSVAWSLPPPLSAQTAAQQARADSLFSRFSDITPGASAVVVREGEVVFRAGYGMANLDHGIPVDPGTVFDIASVSKQFAGMAVAMLVEEGRIDLDAEVRTYLPEFPDFGTPLTVRHLVHHVSGIRDWPATLALAGWRMDDVISFDQILRMARAQKELNFPPGQEYSYSNTGYNLLAEIVSRVTGTPFPEWMEQEVFAPLGMDHSGFQDDHTRIVPRRAQGYGWEPGRWTVANNGLTALGSSSLHSSVDDMAKWLVNYDTHEVGGDEVIQRMRTRGVLTSGDTIAYAYGISGGDYRDRETWTHSGSWAGNRTYLVHFPGIRSGVVILSNAGVYNPSPDAYRLADIFFGDLLGPEEEGAPAAAASETPNPTPAQSAAELAAYSGTWASDELDTRYVLDVEDGSLVAKHFRHGTIVLTPGDEADTFRSTHWFFQPVRFERDASGAVTTMLVGEGRARNLRFVREERTEGP